MGKNHSLFIIRMLKKIMVDHGIIPRVAKKNVPFDYFYLVLIFFKGCELPQKILTVLTFHEEMLFSSAFFAQKIQLFSFRVLNVNNRFFIASILYIELPMPHFPCTLKRYLKESFPR